MSLANVGKDPAIKAVLEDARDVVKLFKRQTQPQQQLASQQRLHGVTRGLVMDATTRFSSKYDMLDSLLANKEALRSTVAQEGFQGKLPR